MSNRVAKIREHSYLKWNYVPTSNNLADLGSRGCELGKLYKFSWNGPEWLRDCKNWPEQLDITNNDESEVKRKMVKELLATTVDLQNPTDTLLNKITLRKTLFISVLISNKSLLAEKIVEEAHLQTIYGGVTLTMARTRDQYWIPTLRQLVKRIVKRCHSCKRLNISHYPKPSQGLIPTDRTKQDLPFSVIGTDYAGPFICKTNGKRDIKVYLLLFTCSLTRAVHLEILPNQTTQEFIQALKRLIARRGRQKVIYSDNAKTFEKATKWIKRVYKDEGMQEFLVTEQVKWKFNLSRAPWWGG